MSDTAARRWAEFDLEHPEIWEAFEDAALRMILHGMNHYSARAILHYIRFETSLRTGTIFKINNNCSPYYSRKFTAKHPQHGDFFRRRSSRFDSAEAA